MYQFVLYCLDFFIIPYNLCTNILTICIASWKPVMALIDVINVYNNKYKIYLIYYITYIHIIFNMKKNIQILYNVIISVFVRRHYISLASP